MSRETKLNRAWILLRRLLTFFSCRLLSPLDLDLSFSSSSSPSASFIRRWTKNKRRSILRETIMHSPVESTVISHSSEASWTMERTHPRHFLVLSLLYSAIWTNCAWLAQLTTNVIDTRNQITFQTYLLPKGLRSHLAKLSIASSLPEQGLSKCATNPRNIKEDFQI